MSNLKITICAIAKNEERYIEDWLKYHYELGFDNITIYDNNIPERKGELRAFINSSIKLTPKMITATEVIDATGKIGYQQAAYNEYYKRGGFDWCMFIDIDEFVTLVRWNNIRDMVNDVRFRNATAISLIWDNISDDNIVDVPDDFIYNGVLAKNITDPMEREKAATEWEKIPVYERLHTSRNVYEGGVVKNIIRGGLHNAKIDLHSYKCDNQLTKLASGDIRKISSYFIRENRKVTLRNQEFAYVRHYRTKTLREFLRQKYLNKSDADNYSIRTLFIDDYFFRINQRTPEKTAYYDTYHQPVGLTILSGDNKVLENNNLCYKSYKCRKSSNPFIIDIKSMKTHINAIDTVVVV